jgi:hypothetical protein
LASVIRRAGTHVHSVKCIDDLACVANRAGKAWQRRLDGLPSWPSFTVEDGKMIHWKDYLRPGKQVSM